VAVAIAMACQTTNYDKATTYKLGQWVLLEK
jgi:hypothetical protein